MADIQMAGQMEQQQQDHPSPASSQDRSKSVSNNQSLSLSGPPGGPNAGIASFRRYVILIYMSRRVVLYSFFFILYEKGFYFS